MKYPRLRNWSVSATSITFAILIFSVSTFSCGGKSESKPGSLERPVVNPYPQKMVSLFVSGDEVSQLKIYIMYRGNERIDGCSVRVGPGAIGAVGAGLEFVGSTIDHSNIVGRIIPDFYLPGKCHWYLSGITVDLPISRGKHQLGEILWVEPNGYNKNYKSEELITGPIMKFYWHCPARGKQLCHSPDGVDVPRGVADKWEGRDLHAISRRLAALISCGMFLCGNIIDLA